MLIYSMSEPNTTLITAHTIRINILLSVVWSGVIHPIFHGASISFYGGEKVAHLVLLFWSPGFYTSR